MSASLPLTLERPRQSEQVNMLVFSKKSPLGRVWDEEAYWGYFIGLMLEEKRPPLIEGKITTPNFYPMGIDKRFMQTATEAFGGTDPKEYMWATLLTDGECEVYLTYHALKENTLCSAGLWRLDGKKLNLVEEEDPVWQRIRLAADHHDVLPLMPLLPDAARAYLKTRNIAAELADDTCCIKLAAGDDKKIILIQSLNGMYLGLSAAISYNKNLPGAAEANIWYRSQFCEVNPPLYRPSTFDRGVTQGGRGSCVAMPFHNRSLKAILKRAFGDPALKDMNGSALADAVLRPSQKLTPPGDNSGFQP